MQGTNAKKNKTQSVLIAYFFPRSLFVEVPVLNVS